MSITYRLDREKGIGYTCWIGTITADEFLVQTRRNLQDPYWPPERGLLLIDLRNAWLDRTIDESIIHQILNDYSEGRERIQNLRVAIAANSLFETAKVFERIASGYSASVIVFNDLDTACTWLGVDLQAAEKTLQEMREQVRNTSM